MVITHTNTEGALGMKISVDDILTGHIYIYMCIYICIYIYMHIHIHIYIYIYILRISLIQCIYKHM
jgi:hypothetical protein